MRTLKLIILSLMVCCVQSAWAEEVTIDGIKYSLDESNRTATLVIDGDVNAHYSSYTGDIVVPSSLECSGITYTVTAIGSYAFYHSSLTSITIPEGVTSLGNNCFLYCSSLTSITIPESVTSLGDNCFSYCSSLTSITIPESVTSLGEGCFTGCRSLTSITIPESVTSLGGGCFGNCRSLTSITIPESVTSLGDYCFRECSSLTSINIPESVTSLGEGCFFYCSSLTGITIPEGVTSLGDNCFEDCRSLTSINIPESVTSLGYECFACCSSLTSIDLPKNITSLGSQCFSGCNNLTVMRVYAETPPDLGMYPFPNLKVYVYGKALEQYQNSSWARSTKIIYPFIEQIELASDFSMARGAEKKMDYKLLPEGADDDAVDWSSGDSSIASVSANGILKAFQLGKVSINATATDRGNAFVTKFVTNSTTIVVRDSILAQSINIPSEVSVMRKSTYTFTPTISPSTADLQTLAWVSDNESVATVDGNGVVTGVGPGTATITATTTDGSNLSASCVITVISFGSEWTEVTNSNIGSLTGGSVIKICPYVCGENENMALSSSTTGGTYYDYVLTSTELAGQEGGNKWILVDAGDGTFYLRNGVGLYWAFQQSNAQNYYMHTVSRQSDAVKVSLVWNTTYSGVAFKNAHDDTYLCNLKGGDYGYNWYNGDEPLTSDTNYTYNVYVRPSVSRLTLSQTTATMSSYAETLQLTATVLPANADGTLVWSSSDESVATVTSTGLVTAVSNGTATITATTTDGSNLSASCVITVISFDSEWTKVTNSNIGSLTGGSVIKICPYGYGGNEDMALSSSTTGGTYYDYVLTSTELAGQEGGNKWILVDAGDGTFYLRNGVGIYWAFQRSDAQNYYMNTVSDQSDAVKVSLVWNTTYSGVVFENAHDGTYLCNLKGGNYGYNWYDGDEPLTSDTNYTYNVYVRPSVSRLTLSQTTATMRSYAETLQLTATVLPANADNTLVWSSSDESVATVTSTGLVTTVSEGTATITATTTDGSNLSASCVITVANFGSEWTKVTNSNIGSLTGGSVIKICPYGYGGNEDMALSSSTTGGTYYDYILTSTERAGQEGGNEWTLVDAGDGTFYLRNGVGLYWAFQQSNALNYYMSTVSDQSDAVKVSLVWNTTYSGVAFKNAHDGTYLNNLYGYNYRYNWYGGDEPLTYDSNTTYNVYVFSDKAAGIDGISADEETDAVYYQLNGVKLAGEPQNEGIYIRVKDGQSRKVLVKRK